MKVILFGATGMVGSGVLFECLDSPRVSSVLVVGRSSSGVTHAKLREVLHRDFLNFDSLRKLAMPFKAAYMFRPGYIQPLRGVRTKTLGHRVAYGALAALYPLLRLVIPKYATTTANVGRAMIEVAAEGYERKIVATTDINALAELAKTHEGAVSSRGTTSGEPR